MRKVFRGDGAWFAVPYTNFAENFANFTLEIAGAYILLLSYQRKTKEQQLKGKIVSALFTLFGTFWHFSTVFTLFQSFSEFFLQDFFWKLRGFTTILVQRDEKRIKEDKKEKTKPFCTSVVARLSSSNLRFWHFVHYPLKIPLVDREPFVGVGCCQSTSARKTLCNFQQGADSGKRDWQRALSAKCPVVAASFLRSCS